MINGNDTWKKNNKSKKKNVSVMTSCISFVHSTNIILEDKML